MRIPAKRAKEIPLRLKARQPDAAFARVVGVERADEWQDRPVLIAPRSRAIRAPVSGPTAISPLLLQLALEFWLTTRLEPPGCMVTP